MMLPENLVDLDFLLRDTKSVDAGDQETMFLDGKLMLNVPLLS